MLFVNMLLECFASDGPWNEMSSRQGNTAIIMEYALPIMYVLFEPITFAFEMVPSTEMTFVVTRARQFQLASLSTLVSKFGNGLLHDVNQSKELL